MTHHLQRNKDLNNHVYFTTIHGGKNTLEWHLAIVKRPVNPEFDIQWKYSSGGKVK